MFKLILFTFFLQGCVGYTSLSAETPSDQTDLGALLAQKSSKTDGVNGVGDAALNENETSPQWTEDLKDAMQGDTGKKWSQTSEGMGQNNPGDSFGAGHGGKLGASPGGKFGAGPSGDFEASPSNQYGDNPNESNQGGKFGSNQGGKFGSKRPFLETGNVDLISPSEEAVPPSYFPGEPVESAARGGTSIYGEDIHDNPVVDILVIKDVSLSMSKIISRKSSDGVVGNLNSLDWRIGFLSADVNHIGFMQLILNREPIIGHYYIDKHIQQHEKTFADTLTLSRQSIPCVQKKSCGRPLERPLGALNKFLNEGSAQYPFLRQGADLAVIIITDNDENRYGANKDMTTHSDIMATMKEKYPDKNIKGYSITVLEDGCRQDVKRRSVGSEANSSAVINDFAINTGGRIFDICNSSYAEVAAAITEHQIGVLAVN